MHTFGHRNVQGLAQRADGTLWSIEQGTYRDDEVNLLVNGGDYGYNPVPGYNESVPMTDQSLPGKQVKAPLALRQPDPRDLRRRLRQRRQSGAPSTAPSRWPASRPAGSLFLTFDADGKLQQVRAPARAAAVRPDPARSRSAENGDLLVTTDNGGGDDVILRVSPR